MSFSKLVQNLFFVVPVAFLAGCGGDDNNTSSGGNTDSIAAFADDLKEARKVFHPLSNAAVALAQALRRGDKEFTSVKVFRCPMTKTVFPGAPASGEWIQLNPSIHNPYMGVQMQDCGTEVKP